MQGENLTITKTAKGKLPSLPFRQMKDAVLGKNYDLSLVFIGDKLSQRLNRERREKDKPTNILSFSLDKTAGEIFINLRLSRKQASDFEREYENFVAFLFIHGLFHLKGFDHGSRMESKEKEIRKQFGI